MIRYVAYDNEDSNAVPNKVKAAMWNRPALRLLVNQVNRLWIADPDDGETLFIIATLILLFRPFRAFSEIVRIPDQYPTGGLGR